MKRLILYFLSFFLIIFLSSCSLTSFGQIPAAVDSKGMRICMIPLALDIPGQKKSYYKSKTGKRISQNIERLIQLNEDDTTFIDAHSLEQEVTSYFLTEPEWGLICEERDIDFVITGAIKKFKLHDPKNTTFFRGQATVDIRVINNKSEVLFSDTLSNIFYPDRRSEDPDFDIPGAHNFGISPEKIRVGLENVIAMEVATLFYDHPREE